MKLQFYPSIKVHCWGGFGSQLNAVALVHRLSERFTHRKITLYIHEGGRHKAVYELQDIDLSNFNIKFMKDFNDNNFIARPNSKINLSRIAKLLLAMIGFYNSCDSLKDIQKLKPWVLIIRGSYNLFPTNTFLDFLKYQLREMNNAENFDVVIHYRLGDLLKIQEKNPVEASMLVNLLISIGKQQKINKIIVLTSDPDIANSLFKKIDTEVAATMKFYYAKPIEVLNFGIRGKIFIGTNSKMSLWPIWLRTTNNYLDNYLPYNFKNDLNFLDQFSVNKFGISFY